MPNRLAQETSPYLLQHKDNPVDWYPWGEEALSKARELDLPIFLSVGYSACHWCHVMERESFENGEIAALMNDLFVNIKVDREERPDVDSIYMSAVQSMTGHGGWPMSVFLSPDGKPFYGGTYFPNEDRGGMPSFPRILTAVAEAYRERRDEIEQSSTRILNAISSQSSARMSVEPIAQAMFYSAYRHLAPEFDWQRGGIGLQPKFPQPMMYEFLLTHAELQDNGAAQEFVDLTLTKIARGGIYDQVGGGFHRYSVDSIWLVPHFEKMLYDNGQLANLYLHAWQRTDNPFFAKIVEETLNYLDREMRHRPSGAFYSATDADSEGEEGKFFVWQTPEMEQVLGSELARVAMVYWDAARTGNFEGQNILNMHRSDDSAASELGISVDELASKIGEAKRLLYAARLRRVPPMTDDKVITSWNALVMRAFAEAGAAFNREDWVAVAVQNAEFIFERLVRDDGRLMRSCKADSDVPASILGFLEDYAYLADALTHLYEATFDLRWLERAEELCDAMIELFWDPADGIFYDTGSDQEALIVRPRDTFDNAQPCGGSAASLALLRCAEFTGNVDLERIGAANLRSMRDLMERAPSAFSWWLQAAQFYANPIKQVVIVGERGNSETEALLAEARRGFNPDRIVALLTPGDEDGEKSLPLFEGRRMIDELPTAYVCRNYACELPVNDVEALQAQLNQNN